MKKRVKKIKRVQSKRVKPENYFYLCDGGVLKNLKELAKTIRNMPEEHFEHHVNSNNNDFANWVIHVLKEAKLGEEMLRTTDKDTTELLLLRKLYY